MAKKKQNYEQDVSMDDPELFEEVGTVEDTEEYDSHDGDDGNEEYDPASEQEKQLQGAQYDESLYEPEDGEDTWDKDSHDLVKNVDSMVEAHRSNTEDKGKIQGLMTPSECISSDRCTVIRKNHRLEQQIKDKQDQYHKVMLENEHLRRALKEKIPKAELENLVFEAVKSPEVQSLKNHNLSLQQHLKERDEYLMRLKKQIQSLQAERKDYYTNSELDRKYTQKKNELKQMTYRVDVLRNREDELKSRIHAVETKHDKLVEAYNEKVRELRSLMRKIKESKTILKKGISLKPEGIPKKKGGIKRIFPWPARD